MIAWGQKAITFVGVRVKLENIPIIATEVMRHENKIEVEIFGRFAFCSVRMRNLVELLFRAKL